MNELRVTVPFNENETIASFCSRIAAANGIPSATEFGKHLGFNFARLAEGRSAEVSRFAALVKMPPDLLTRNLSVQRGLAIVDSEKSHYQNCGQALSDIVPPALSKTSKKKLAGGGRERTAGSIG